MGNDITIVIFFSYVLLLPLRSASYPLCVDSRTPLTPKTPLAFCSYNGSVCCDSTEDFQLQKLFEAMNSPDPACAALLKSILCAKCDQFSAEIFEVESGTRTVPVLCTVSEISNQSTGAANDFCGEVWYTCQKTLLLGSPFAHSLQGREKSHVNSTSKLSDIWHSESAFCKEFGGSSDNGKLCFSGNSVSLQKTSTPQPLNGVCLEKIANGSYVDMAAHPDGSNRVFIGNLQGKIWLATVPEEGSGEILVLDDFNLFLDITDIIYFGTELGMMSMAFHPNFSHNGRFFVSFNCDKLLSPGCAGKCSCNTDVACDPSKFGDQNGVMICQYHAVISEFTANNTASQPSVETRGNPSEVRRIFTMGILYTNANGGQILFGPDGYLYLMTGAGQKEFDAFNFAQNKKSLLGKTLRFDVDNIPSAAEISDRGLWGNYSIPKDNPYYEDKELLPEIFALGFRNPWRCNFDSERPSYFLCADSGQDQYEEVDIVTKGGNYGWRYYEGTTPIPRQPSERNMSLGVLNLSFPVMGYDHSPGNTMGGSASIAGGYFYRSDTDPCMYGRYLYTDLYGFAIWAGTENPENSGNFTTAKLSFRCARDSPIQCSSGGGHSLPLLGYVFSMGSDNRKDVFFLTSKGVLRVARPSRCNYACSKEHHTAIKNPRVGPLISTGKGLRNSQKLFVFLFLFLLLLNFTL